MKKILFKKLFLFFFSGILVISCTSDTPIEEDVIQETITAPSTNRTSKSKLPSLESSGNKLIVILKSNLTEKQKQAVRNRHGVIDYEKCSCESDIELWEFGGNINIEDKKEEVNEEEDVGGAYVDNRLPLLDDLITTNPSIPDTNLLQKLIKGTNSGVTIAILDTGLDYTDPTFAQPFLYKHSSVSSCRDDTLYDTWNYTNNPNTTLLDDHGHGTCVTKIIYSQLVQSRTNFQILPIPVFDAEGNSTLFKVICGIMYAADHNAKIVNLSFGWYSDKVNFLNELFAKNSNMLYVASAGNRGINVDETTPHYPSNYIADNLLSVAGINANLTRLWDYSNYGTLSIDIAAPSENISIDNDLPISGTSFSAAYGTARAAQLFINNQTPSVLKQRILQSGSYLGLLGEFISHPVYIDGNDE